jgi:hypothetical protein
MLGAISLDASVVTKIPGRDKRRIERHYYPTGWAHHHRTARQVAAVGSIVSLGMRTIAGNVALIAAGRFGRGWIVSHLAMSDAAASSYSGLVVLAPNARKV